MSRMIVAMVAVVAALFGAALTVGLGAFGSGPVQAAPVQVSAPVAAKRAAYDPAAPYTRVVMEKRLKERFSQTDHNRDGFVTRAETESASDKARSERRSVAFGAMDKDANGSVSRAEFDAQANERRDLFRQSRKERVRSRAASRRPDLPGFIGTGQFERMDKDANGQVSLDEALARAVTRFERSDTNGDGRLTAAERKAARQEYRSDRRRWNAGAERSTRGERYGSAPTMEAANGDQQDPANRLQR